jgi:hypothetical protein
VLERRKPEVDGKRPKAPKEPERTGGVLVVGPPLTKEEFEKKHGGPQPLVEVEFEGSPSPAIRIETTQSTSTQLPSRGSIAPPSIPMIAQLGRRRLAAPRVREKTKQSTSTRLPFDQKVK